jgi:hypothetical protein
LCRDNNDFKKDYGPRTDRVKLRRVICYSIWNKEKFSEHWKESNLPIYKMGDKICSNYRGISLFSNKSKIISSILLSRLIPHGEEIIGNRQCGVRLNRSRSTTDHIFCTVLCSIQYCVLFNTEFCSALCSFQYLFCSALYFVLDCVLFSTIFCSVLCSVQCCVLNSKFSAALRHLKCRISHLISE